MAASKEQLEQLIELYLQVNPEPSDAQFHALAEALSVDKETLEAVSYEMLGEELTDGERLVDVDDVEAAIGGQPQFAAMSQTTTKDQDVIEDQYDPNTTGADYLAINDSAPGLPPAAGGFQDETRDDGVGIEDSGLDIELQDIESNDGVPAINAATRLKIVAAKANARKPTKGK